MMIHSIKTFRLMVFVPLLLITSGCASTAIEKNISNKISVAPAIDVPYGEVIKSTPDHIGVNVRWGGQVIGVEDVDGRAQLMVLAYPLNRRGQPEQEPVDGFVGGRFIVETDNYETKGSSRFLTVYGPISRTEILTNGRLKKAIPVVTALETKEWSDHEQRYARNRKYHLPYNGLGVGIRLGHVRVGYGGYGYFRTHPFFYPYTYFGSRSYRSRRFR
ncbi:hypothetical protein NBRC116583_16600 [Arenicella sp. 4NH20-0111]|uniref:Slp family lipoprotein n=1 Tax=Arenicella sp. 4NH20-0111 TaxID=3127648 RepID=UPI00310C3E8B